MKKTTLAELARLAGCSISQASRAVTGNGPVAPQLRNNVRSLAMQHDYRNLSNNHRPKISILCSRSFGFHDSHLIHALVEHAEKCSWNCMICTHDNLPLVRELFIDGVVFIGHDNDYFAANWPAQSTLPLVVVNNSGNPLEDICEIRPDQDDEHRLILEHLSHLGHRRIARLFWVPPDASELQKNNGITAFFQQANAMGLTEVENVVFHKESELPMHLNLFLQKGFTAFLIVNQHLTLPAVHTLTLLGKRIPQDVSIMGYEVEWVSEYLDPPLTTIDFDYDELARISLCKLAKLMQNHSLAQEEKLIRVPNKLHIRSSTGRVPPSFEERGQAVEKEEPAH